jgi:amino-acid N-acetyltransferase
MAASIDRAASGDVDPILRLLQEHHLPIEGLREHLDTALVAREEGKIVGSAALERYRDAVLLRSVAVSGARRGRGLGGQLTEAAIDLARALGARTVYLLTTTAEGYFPRFGFERIDRAEVPASVQASVEFATACPASAIVMRKSL